LPHRIETDRHGRILMSPPPASAHGNRQSRIAGVCGPGVDSETLSRAAKTFEITADTLDFDFEGHERGIRAIWDFRKLE
jgi:hypothetical protein